MLRSQVAVCILACLAAVSAQKPSPISADEAGSGPAVPQPPAISSASSSPAVAPAVPAVLAGAPSDRPGCTLGSFHAVGESWPTNGREGCLKYTCQRSGVVSSQPCPRILTPEGCSVKEGNADALYPACCSKRECVPGVPGVPGVPVPLPAILPAEDSKVTPSGSSSPSTGIPTTEATSTAASTGSSGDVSTSTTTASTTTAKA